MLGGQFHVPPKAKRVIYLFMAGGPSQMETFDYKPVLNAAQRRAAAGFRAPGAAAHRHVRQPVVAAARGLAVRVRPARQQRHVGQRPAAAHREGRRRPVHRPLDVHRGDQPRSRRSRSSRPDRRSPGGRAWARGFTTGSGSDNENLPAFVVLITPGKVDQPLYSRLWGSGFLPSQHQGVQFRSGKDPVLYLGNPGRRLAREPAAAARSAEGAARARGRAARRHGDRRRASRSTRWRTACRPASRA